MWIALNNAFLSIVEPKEVEIPPAERWQHRPLMVRARRKVHLTRVFPRHHVYEFKGRDYPCRMFIDRAEVAERVRSLVAHIAYGNFKDSVRDNELHDAYMGIWSTMHRYQRGAYRRKRPSADQPYFGWGVTQEQAQQQARDELQRRIDNPQRISPILRDEVCGMLGCTPMNPCRDCVSSALDTRYGDFDENEDIDALSHLRVPPK